MEKFKQLEQKLNTISDIGRTVGILAWDQEVIMPSGGAEARANEIGTLSGIHHELSTSDEMAQLLADVPAELAGLREDSYKKTLLRVVKKDFEKAVKVPAEFVARQAKATTLAHGKWNNARSNNDYKHFQPSLEKLFALAIEKAGYLGYEEHPYDALLDQFEPGMTTTVVEDILGDLRQKLVPIVQAINTQLDQVDDSCLRGDFSEASQHKINLEVAEALGYDFTKGRLDVAPHPFTSGFGSTDVRITTRYDETLYGSALFGVIHEVGHGLYEQGFDPRHDRTPLGNSASLGVHESQSRLWENQIGRSYEFWQYLYPKVQTVYPNKLANVSLHEFYRAVNRVEPGWIRVDADEVTYNLHIMLRAEMEKDLIAGNLSFSELPARWDDLMESYLGIRPDSDANGVLQDIHWSSSLIGYFPTYTIGTIASAQLYDAFLEDHPDFPQKMQQGEFGDVLTWMRTRIHQPGRIYEPLQLIERACGQPLSSDALIAYISEKYGKIYEL